MESASTAPAPGRVEVTRPGRPSPLLGAAHIAAIWALAIAQPLLELLGRNTTFFVARGNGAEEIVAFALILTVLPFLAIWAIESALEPLWPAGRWVLHLVFLAAVTACLFLQLIGQLTQRPAGLIVVASILLAAGAVWLYVRARFARAVFDFLTPAPVVVLVLYLIVGPTSALVFPAADPEPFAVEPERPAPVLMIVFDELPTGSLLDSRGRIDASRYPSFAALASESTWYRQATTVAAFTSAALPAILTGRNPDPERLPIAVDHPESIFTLLGSSHRLTVFEDATKLCPEDLCPEAAAERTVASGLGPLFADLSIVSRHLLLPDALRTGLPDISETFGGFAAEIDGGPVVGEAAGGDAHVVAMAIARETSGSETARVARFANAVASAAGGERGAAADERGAAADERRAAGDAVAADDDMARPGFSLLHTMKPHYPWRNLPDGRVYSPDMGEWIRFMDDESVWQAPRSVTDIALQRHLLEVGHADSLLARLVARLRAAGIWDEALVVVTADHGGAMIPGIPRRNPTRENIGQVAPVPLFVKAPEQRRGAVVDGSVCTTTIVPIVAEQLGVEMPWSPHECAHDSVFVADLPDGGVEAPLAEVRAGNRAYVDRIERLFGTAAGWDPVYSPRFGRPLIGRPVAGSEEGASTARAGAPRRGVGGERVAPLTTTDSVAGQSATPDDPDAALEHRPRELVVPALLQRGRLEGVPPDTPIAIAANGRIAAIGRSYDLEGVTTFSILLPPAALRPGHNEIEIFRIRGPIPHDTARPGSDDSHDTALPGSAPDPPTAPVTLQPLWP